MKRSFFKALLLLFTLSSGVLAGEGKEQTLLLVAEDNGEVLIVDSYDSETITNEDTIEEDLALLRDGEFDLKTFAKEHLQIDGQVRASLMTLEVKGSLGIRTLNDYVEVGVDTSVLLVAAGTDGAIIPQVGTYVKVRLTPQKAKTVYFAGRVYKAWGLAEGRKSNKEFSIGYEWEGQHFIELAVKEFQREGEGNLYLPFIGFGMKFGGPRPQAEKSELLFDEE